MENIVKEHILLKQKYNALLKEYNYLKGTFNLTVDLVDGYLKNIIAERNDLRARCNDFDITDTNTKTKTKSICDKCGKEVSRRFKGMIKVREFDGSHQKQDMEYIEYICIDCLKVEVK